ncbi:hypothetical protein DFH07DRAFT_776748 [Mycena maculata]|uniref:FAD/NAD(P)-binding domain-containing protein n=1 Tax=Mycena maculata TaxID=230809 RepID=A0AAD7N5L6_9AGAR|nr:hypothetical protein DFH07DRAFT_776748 [Mycena maculata]
MSFSKIAADTIILGGGPAGLSAALALSRMLRTSIPFDSEEYRNAPAAEMHTVLGFDGAPPAQFRATARRQIGHYYGRTTINARPTGAISGPSGVQAAWGKQFSIVHFAMARKSPTNVLSLLLYSGPVPEAFQLAYDNFTKNKNPVISPSVSRIEECTGSPGVILHFEDGHPRAEFNFIVMGAPCRQAASFSEQLGLELDERNYIVVKGPFGATSAWGFRVGGLRPPWNADNMRGTSTKLL